jgi:hypothetical protein
MKTAGRWAIAFKLWSNCGQFAGYVEEPPALSAPLRTTQTQTTSEVLLVDAHARVQKGRLRQPGRFMRAFLNARRRKTRGPLTLICVRDATGDGAL